MMESVKTSSSRPVSHLGVSWGLIVTLVYFASQGTFWFQSVSSNNSLSISYGSLATQSMTLENVVVATSVFAIMFGALFFRVNAVIKRCLEDKIFSLFCLLAIASCIWSQFPIVSLEYSLCFAANTLLAFYLYRRFSPQQQIGLFVMLGWICLTLSIGVSLYFPRYGLEQAGGGSVNAWRGIYPHKNICALITLILMPAGFYSAATTLLSKAFRFAYLGLSMFVVFMTQSRTGWVILACLLFYVAALNTVRRVDKNDRGTLLILGAIAVLSLIFAVVVNSNEIFYFLGKDPTLTGRTEIWKAVFPSLMKHPFLGYGYRAFWRGYQGESANVELGLGFAAAHAHNGFLDIWLTLGALGLGLTLHSLFRAIRDAAVCLRAGNESHILWYVSIVLLVVIVNLDEAEVARPNDLAWILYILACVGLSEGARHIRLCRDHV
jgi:exopolysaccharide production protein ExoQ